MTGKFLSLSLIFSLLIGLFVVVPVLAQSKEEAAAKPVDQTKLLLGDLYRLGDPEINKMMPALYKALKATEVAATDESAAPAKTRMQQAMPNVMSMLVNPSVRKEIDMMDYQYDDIRQRHAKIIGSMNEQIVTLLKSEDSSNLGDLREQLGQIRANAAEEVEQAILPHQYDRLKQLRYHVLMRRLGPINVITSNPLAEEIGLSPSQSADLRQSAQEINEELEQQIAELRSRAMDKLFSQLETDQQRKLNDIMGDQFLYQESSTKKAQPGKGKGKAKQK
ncbi:MAG: hypothetical protein COA78_35400 [Blastopirellula sp.]|nr:MAG: hypothetical protein COA78_35400 [Blastopirellula sp.]